MSHTGTNANAAQASQNTSPLPSLDYAAVRASLLAGEEIALIDVRGEDPFAQSHPLWAANFPLSRLELDAWSRIPRRDTKIVIYGEDASGDLSARAAAVLHSLGYTKLHQLTGGLAGWIAAGGEVFRDVNVPSKSFGELVEETRHTPSLSAQEVKQLIDDRANVVVLDARRFDEYQTMSIPGATSVPGAELVLRVRALAPDPTTQVIVNCAGRTRSIIGTQSLVNAGIPNPVAALRNGTIGWKLAGQQLAHGADSRAPGIDAETRQSAQADARRVADRAGVWRIARNALSTLVQPDRTLYRFDVRTPEEYAAGHLPGFANAPGGQLVQETDHVAPVRGARIVLADDDGVRADMSASWLAQMGWEVYVLDPASTDGFTETGHPDLNAPPPPAVNTITASELGEWLHQAGADDVQVLDVTPSANYVKGHIPGAWFAVRAELAQALQSRPRPRRYVFTCGTSLLARFAAADAARLTDVPIYVLDGGTRTWAAAGNALEAGETGLASARTDRYRRPYEGTDAPAQAMQAYLDWEFGLVAQLGRDGTHGFRVV
ncbi:rhodanese-related sulfurtransferase [Pigmentiphaga aceris]|uniref:Rhodanese-related sulfurtransferase n=1 Tax=Pigmentiphaga aceris TaxID=1940612 RepID=A0A5C0AZS8_9BURK|nr:rhodanese-related sulfurtransferase [Pigmentiphaga aceris]QEI07114.1 rhodanese-related sulfurtransferase [Pigmentiphaga aceris]